MLFANIGSIQRLRAAWGRSCLAALMVWMFSLPHVAVAASAEVPFSFNLTTAAKTSAGVYKPDGTMVRTLWSGVPYSAGTYTKYWDGKDDDGTLLSNGSYKIKVLSNNVSYVWEGVVGNSSTALTGDAVHRNSEYINAMVIEGTTAYYETEYYENTMMGHKFNLSTPQTHATSSAIFNIGGIGNIATDGRMLYRTQSDSCSHDANGKMNLHTVFATNLTNGAQLPFQYGIAQRMGCSIGLSSAINIIRSPDGIATGLAVQRSGKYLFVAHGGLNQIRVLNKTTGALVTTIKMKRPRQMLADQNNLWVVSDVNTVARYPVLSNGMLGTAALKLTGLLKPIALAMSPDGRTLLVADDGASQQVKAYDPVMMGRQKWVLGTAGGYRTDATVTNNKFYFSDEMTGTKKQSVLAFQPDGSFWVGDTGNGRLMHFAANRTFIDDIQQLQHPYMTYVDPNDPTRLFQSYREFKIDYSKPLAPNNGSWKLVRNWGQIPDAYDTFQGLISVITLSNNRTYGLLRARNVYGSNVQEVHELVPGGQLRFTGTRLHIMGRFDKTGNYRWLINTSTAQEWHERALTGFDGNNNPIFGPDMIIASTNQIAPPNPIWRGANPSVLTNTASGLLLSFDDSGATIKKYHLGAIMPGETTWKWRTAMSTEYNYRGEFPTDGSFDIGNDIGGVHTYAGSVALVSDRNIFWGYHGEFWRGSQTNKWNHVFDDGLFIGQFGTTGPEHKEEKAPAEMAGNSFQASLATLPDGRVYLYHGDESYHAGVHRWRVDGLNSIAEQEATVALTANGVGLTGQYFETATLDNMDFKLQRIDSQIDFAWGSAAPAGSAITGSDYSVRWKGFVTSPTAETRTFYLRGAKGLRLWVDDQLLVDRWANSGLNEYSGTVAMEAGKRYKIRVEAQNSPSLSLSWSGPSQAKAILPNTALFASTDDDSQIAHSLNYGLPYYSSVENNLYGWTRNPAVDSMINRYSDWWQVGTNRHTIKKDPPDLFVSFDKVPGSTASVSRNLGTVANATAWSLAGRVSFAEVGGNDTVNSTNGQFLDVLDTNGKIIARLLWTIGYTTGYTNTLYLNNVQVPGATGLLYPLHLMIDKLQPIDITASASGITLRYANYAPITVPVYDATSNWRNPKAMRVFMSRTGSRGLGQKIAFDDMKFGANYTVSAAYGVIPVDRDVTVFSTNGAASINVQHPAITHSDAKITVSNSGGTQTLSFVPVVGSTNSVLNVGALPGGTYNLYFVNGPQHAMKTFSK